MKISIPRLKTENGLTSPSSLSIIAWINSMPEKVEVCLEHSLVSHKPFIACDNLRLKDFSSDNDAMLWAEKNNMTIVNGI